MLGFFCAFIDPCHIIRNLEIRNRMVNNREETFVMFC